MWRMVLIWVPDDKTRQQAQTIGDSDVGGSGGGGTVALVDAIVFAWKTAKAVWWMASNFAVGLAVITVALYRATRWTVQAAKRGYRWYATRTVVLDREPVAAITATTTAMTLRDLRLKEPANS